MEAVIYNEKGKEAGKVKLPENIFGLPWNADLVKQVADSLTSSKRKPVAHTKDRSDVSGGGKKPWRQKGTGRARHGSTRSPIWVGGGVTHGPRNEKNFDRKVSKKMRAKALFTILSRKYKDGEVLFVDGFNFSKPKTKDAVLALHNLAGVKGYEQILKKRKNSAVIATSGKNVSVERSFQNLSNVEVLETRNLHPLALLEYKYVVIENPEEAFKNLPGKSLTKTEKSESAPRREKKSPASKASKKKPASKTSANLRAGKTGKLAAKS